MPKLISNIGLRLLLKSRHMQLKDLAAMSGRHRNLIVRWAEGEGKYPGVEADIAKALGITVQDLRGRVGHPVPKTKHRSNA